MKTSRPETSRCTYKLNPGRVNVVDRLCNLLHEYCAQLRGWNWKADEAFGATHKATYRDVGNAMNHEYTDAAVEQRESHEDESQD
ncbi:hypothetical protein [Bifidobacterium longum]|uniref:hypothetical protein n=1 Tax=Bifidobacterium longum TaxID=216816 RepID=UPI003D7396E1